MASQLKSFNFSSFQGGYDSFSGSRSNVKDNEIPALPGITKNVILDDNGSPQKRSGFSNWSGRMRTGDQVTGIETFKTTSFTTVIAASGSSWWNCSPGVATPLTGKTFNANQQTLFTGATGLLFGANGTDNLCYTSDGTTVNEITVNGIVGTSPVYYGNRIYMLSSAFRDRVYFSNPYQFTLGNVAGLQGGGQSIGGVVTGFDTANLFVTDLTANPKKNAGFLSFYPGSGVVLTRIYKDGDFLYVYSVAHGIWKMSLQATINSDGTVTHTVAQIVTGIGCSAAKSIATVSQNDQYFYGNDNLYSRGEVQYYASPRVTTQSGRVQSEMRGVTQTAKPNVATVFYLNKVYVAYQAGGTANDSIIVKDTVLNAWSTPFTGVPVSSFLDYTDATGYRHLLAGSSDSNRPYLFELNVGLDDGGVPIAAGFETKSSDCKSPGLIKYGAFADVFFQQLSGTLDCQIIGDETNVLATYSQQQQLVASGSLGVGSQLVGTFLVGAEFTPGSIIAAASYEGQFRIAIGYKKYRRISVRFSNNRMAEQFKINNIVVWYKEGSINTPLK